jgi:hypothetical protein
MVELATPSGKLPLIPLLTISLKLGDLETEPGRGTRQEKFEDSTASTEVHLNLEGLRHQLERWVDK